MNDDVRLERLFADGMTDLAPMQAPARLKTEITEATAEVRPRPRWLAAMKEPPMRISSTLAVGSPTARVAAILVATLLIAAALAGAGLAGTRLLAADGSLVVDQAGGGDYTTIGAAIAAAQDGDSILIRPGTYHEHVIVTDKDLVISGDGARAAVRVEPDGVEPVLELTNTDSTISRLAFIGSDTGVIVQGGSPTLTGLLFHRVGRPEGAASVLDGLVINAFATPTVIDNEFVGGGSVRVIGGSAPLIEGNLLHQGPSISLDNIGEGTTVRGNRTLDTWLAIGLYGPGSPVIEDNVIVGANAAMEIGETGYAAFGTDPEVRRNSISGVESGILIAEGAAPRIEANDIDATDQGLSFGGPGAAVIDGNSICGGKVAVAVAEGMDGPDLAGNTVCEPAPME